MLRGWLVEEGLLDIIRWTPGGVLSELGGNNDNPRAQNQRDTDYSVSDDDARS